MSIYLVDRPITLNYHSNTHLHEIGEEIVLIMLMSEELIYYCSNAMGNVLRTPLLRHLYFPN